jgi:hypothetical protein
MLCGAGGIALEEYWYDATILPLAIIATACSTIVLLVSVALDKLSSHPCSPKLETVVNKGGLH